MAFSWRVPLASCTNIIELFPSPLIGLGGPDPGAESSYVDGVVSMTINLSGIFLWISPVVACFLFS